MRRPGGKRPRGKGVATNWSGSSAGGEWVGCRLPAPFVVGERAQQRPTIILWLELPNDLVVGMDIFDHDPSARAFADSLRAAMKSPLVGPARRPTRIRVAEPTLALEIQGVARGIEIAVAPTPELDRLLEHMAEELPSIAPGAAEPSYLRDGQLSPKLVAQLFRAAGALYRAAPWNACQDQQTFRLEIPALGIEEACVSVIGALGESVGLLIFESIDDFRRFLSVAQASLRMPAIPRAAMVALNFERAADLPARMRHEVAEHGWPVAAEEAYPWVAPISKAGKPRLPTERDVRIAAGCASALASFVNKHPAIFERPSMPLTRESHRTEDGLEVRLAVPYVEGPLPASRFSASDPRTAKLTAAPSATAQPRPASVASPSAGSGDRGKVGRNDPCPCGSGKKYKRCCLGRSSAPSDGPAASVAGPGSTGRAPSKEAAPSAAHRLDNELVERMFDFAARRFGPEWMAEAFDDFDDPETSPQLLGPWAVYHFEVDGKPIVAWFLEAERDRLSAKKIGWLEAQQASWLSVWEVLEAVPGRTIRLHDLLSGEKRTVHEVRASETVRFRDVILGRVVDWRGSSLLGGCHPRLLSPGVAAEVVERARRRLRRKKSIPVDRLRDTKASRRLLSDWEEEVAELDFRLAHPPRLQNTDGDDLLFTVDHFDIEPEAATVVEQRITALEGVEPPEPGDQDPCFAFIQRANRRHSGSGPVLIGRVSITGTRLRLETNSIARADTLRKRLEAACAGLLVHRVREHTDPASERVRDDPHRRPPAPPELPASVVNEAVLEAKRGHYRGWPDDALPALGGKTPRQVVRTAAGRARVDALLRDMENHEARAPDGQRFDFGPLRRELGLATS